MTRTRNLWEKDTHLCHSDGLQPIEKKALEWATRIPPPHENEETEVEIRPFYEFTDFLPGKAVQEARELEKQLVESRG